MDLITTAASAFTHVADTLVPLFQSNPQGAAFFIAFTALLLAFAAVVVLFRR